MKLLVIPAVVVLAMAGAMLWLVRRRQFLPSSAPPPSLTARFVDAMVLGLSAAVIIAIAADGPLDQFPPGYATTSLIMLVCAIASATVAVLITFLGLTVTGTITMAIALIGYGLLVNDGRRQGALLRLNHMAIDACATDYTISPSNADIPGAELWVNGVCLGVLPYRTTLAEFLAKAPYWPKPPEDYETSQLKIPRYGPRGAGAASYRKWIQFHPPSTPTFGRNVSDPPVYYAQIRYAGEWAVGAGSGGGGTSNNQAYSSFSIILPERSRRLDNLLNKARLMDYQVDEHWLEALQTYGRDGWNALQKAATNEPRMKQVLLAWAARRHDIDKAVDADGAWLIFQSICNAADSAGQYSTDSIDGLAVELLAPKLPQQRLVSLAEETIRKTRKLNYCYSYGQEFGKPWFAACPQPKESIPPRVFVLAHAVWKLNEHLEAAGGPNPVQERIVPALICWRQGHAILSLGGQAAYTWLIRHDWRTTGDALHFEDQKYIAGIRVNNWLYQLAHFPGHLGRQFRSQHGDELLKLADEMLEGPIARHGMEAPSFLFLDLQTGKDSLAARYWPKFKGSAVAEAWEPLRAQWEYLVRMEPISTTEQYVDAWRSVTKDACDNQFAIAKLSNLPPLKRREVIAAIRAEVERDPRFASGGPEESWRNNIIMAIDNVVPDDDRARMILDSMVKKDNERVSREAVSLWLAHTRPDHPLVEMLASSDDPELRLMVMGALREYPTPEHLLLLRQLLEDPVSAVRDSAREVESYLNALSAHSPSRYASDAPAVATPITTATEALATEGGIQQ